VESAEAPVKIHKVFNCAIDNIWNAWTDSKLIMKWFGSDPNGKVLAATLDVRPNGTYEITFCDPDGTVHTCYGVYKEVKERSKLSFTWNWKSEPGVESFVTIKLFSDGKKTSMHFEHAGTGTTSIHEYEAGWTTTFEKLERELVL